MTVYAVPNRPDGTDIRNINVLMSNFDYLLKMLNDKLPKENIANGAITGNKFADSLARQLGVSNGSIPAAGHAYSEVLGEETTTSTTYVDLTGPSVQVSVTQVPSIIWFYYSVEGKRDTSGQASFAIVNATGSGSNFLTVAGLSFSGAAYPPTPSENHTGADLVTVAQTYTYKTQYRSTNGTTAYFRNRKLRARVISFA